MKSIKIFATVGAIALLGMTGLTSCNQKNTPVGPGYNGEAIKAEFSISIPEAGKSNGAAKADVLRMPANSTQSDALTTGHFLGMDEMVLIPYETASSGATAADDDDPKNGTDIVLSDLGGAVGSGAGNILPDGLSGTAANYKVYWNVEIPVETNRFLFYAHGRGPSGKAQANYSVAENFEYGHLIASGFGGANASSIQFDLKKIYPTAGTEGDAIVAYLNSLITANDGATPTSHTWADHQDVDINALYTKYLDTKVGSSNSVLALMEDLYNSLEQYNEAYKPAHGGVYDPIVTAVMNAIKDKVNITGTYVGTRTLAWKDGSACANYPQNIHLPDGAATVYWNGSAFAKTDINVTGPQANWMNVTPRPNFVYPSAIYYYANSPLKTSGTPQVNNYSTSNWTTILGLYTLGTEVNSSTRSVAIVNPVQYSVASLKTTVKADAAELKDQKDADINIGSNLKMTAVLVGGQQAVKYDFTPITDGDGDLVIYDSIMSTANQALSTTATTYNPTLVLETNAGKDINIAVEFLNTGDDFYGIDGKLIPKNTKFYVVAKLEADDATNAKLVERGKDGRVFAQDFVTTVNLNLKNLKKAYNVVPDLTTSGLELGFSVDLTWETGYTYDIDIE